MTILQLKVFLSLAVGGALLAQAGHAEEASDPFLNQPIPIGMMLVDKEGASGEKYIHQISNPSPLDSVRTHYELVDCAMDGGRTLVMHRRKCIMAEGFPLAIGTGSGRR